MPTDVLVFSKDRPWQLSEYIRTFKRFCFGQYNIHVIHKSSNTEYANAYDHYFTENKDINGIKEDENMDFSSAFNWFLHIGSSNPYILFGVDDVLFYRAFTLEKAEDALSHPEFFSYSLRLNPHIKYCQPAHCISIIPKLSKYSDEDFTYSRFDGSADWNYPWEVSASIYRRKTVKSIVAAIHQKFGFSSITNPNRLEAHGAILTKNMSDTINNLCLSKQVCSIITVNRVQDEYQNALAGQQQSTDDLLEYYWKKRQYNTAKYASENYDATHIGKFYIYE